jgi:Ca2+-dependent lipid-binding protein
MVAKDRGGTSDPYVKVKFFNHKDKKNKVIYKTLNPKW